MTTLYPRLPRNSAKALFESYRGMSPSELSARVQLSHAAQYFAATGGSRVTTGMLSDVRQIVCELAMAEGFPNKPLGREVNTFDNNVARAIHHHMDLVPAEAAVRPMWAFLALIVFPDVALWRFPDPPVDRLLDTDITRHVFGRLWWRAELLLDRDAPNEYHLLNVFSERNFDRILARRKSIGGSPDIIRSLAKEWKQRHGLTSERDVLEDTLKRLMRRGAFQDLIGLPESLLRAELAIVIEIARTQVTRQSVLPQFSGSLNG